MVHRSFTSALALALFPLLIALCGGASPALAGKLSVIAGGDSLTNGYAPRLNFVEVGFNAAVTTLATGGFTSGHWAATYLNNQQLRSADVVLIMLGTNDAWPDNFAEDRFAAFQFYMRSIVTRIQKIVAPSTEQTGGVNIPKIVIGVPIPILANANAGARIRNWYRPWILDEFREWPGVTTIDFYALIQQQPNWQSFYDDGVHLWAQNAAGYKWMAGVWRDTVIAQNPVPEPTYGPWLLISMTLLLAGCRRGDGVYS